MPPYKDRFKAREPDINFHNMHMQKNDAKKLKTLSFFLFLRHDVNPKKAHLNFILYYFMVVTMHCITYVSQALVRKNINDIN